jgi:DNA primase small subunit
MSNTQQDFSTDLLRIYYGRLFPYESMYNWLSYDSSSAVDSCYFGRREWSFTIEDDIYIRYQSFTDRNEMMEAIQKRQPHKIDIGAVFSVDPSLRATVRPEAFKTIERELVFDVDMTDYDGLRTCCSGANICLKCWPFMTAVRLEGLFLNIIVHIIIYNNVGTEGC